MIAWLVLLQTTLTISVPGPVAHAEYLPLRLAEARGYFAEEKLQVSLRTAPAEAGAAEDLARGQTDLAATTLDAALRLGHTGGIPPRLVFGLTEAPPVALLVPAALRGSVKAIADLAGKTVGLSGPGTAGHALLLSLLQKNDIRVHRVSIRSYGERGVAGAVDKGEVAAGLVADPWATRLIEDGRAVALADFRKRGESARWLGSPTVHAGLFVRADTGFGPPASGKLFRALLKAMADLRSTRPEELAADLSPQEVGFPADFSLRVRGAREIFLVKGSVSPEMLEGSVALSRARSAFPAAVRLPRRLEALLLMEPLKAVLDSGGK